MPLYRCFQDSLHDSVIDAGDSKIHKLLMWMMNQGYISPMVLLEANNEIMKRIVDEEVAEKIRVEQQGGPVLLVRFKRRLHTSV